MTEAKIPRGINVYDVWKAKGRKEGKRWVWRVRDSVRRTYRREAFEDADYDKGLAWAKDQLAKLSLRIETSATSKVADVGKAYQASLESTGRTTRHRAQVKQVLDALVRVGADDMKDPLFPDRVQALLADLTAKRHWQRKAKPASARLKNKHLVIARAVVRYAMARRLITYDPLAILKPIAEPKAAKEVFMLDELRKLLAPKHEGDRWFLFTALAAYTGCRASEVAALRWSMIDWDAKVVRVPPDLPGNKLKRFRRIQLQPELHDILKPRAKVGDVPIVHPDISAMEPPSITHGFQDYAARCEVRPNGRGPHALRHTVAALLTAAGISPFLAMDYLGHSSPTVAKHYAASAQEFVRDVKAWGDRFYLRDAPPRAVRQRPR